MQYILRMNLDQQKNKYQQELIKKLNWGSIDTWTERNFKKLSELIDQQTKIKISYITLKRYFGVIKTQKENYTPHPSTADALAQFIGYKDWYDFSTSIPTDTLNSEDVPLTTINSISKPKRKKHYLWLLSMGIVLVTTLVLSFLVSNRTPKVTFYAMDSVITTPGNAKYFFKADKNSKHLQFSAGITNEKFRIDQSSNFIFHSFVKLGFLQSKIYYKEKAIAITNVLARSDNFEAVLSTPIVSYIQIPDSLCLTKGFFAIPESFLANNDPHNQGVWSLLKVFDTTRINGDNFTFETELMVNDYKDSYNCKDVVIYIYGKTGEIITHFINNHCTSKCEETFNDISIRGNESDLSMFGHDFKDFSQITIKNKNKDVVIYLNSKQIFSQKYTKDMDEIVGIMISIRGFGGIKYIKLNENNSYKSFNKSFDQKYDLN